MATSLEGTSVTYEELAAIEQSFDDAEVEIIRTQNTLLQPLYDQRQTTVSQIPNFWPLVLEQAPTDIDQYIQPSDSELLIKSLTSFSVSRFEPSIDPRSVLISFTFKENEHFSNEVLEKRFWYRRDSKGFAGLVSEPVKISWTSKEKDLTGGLLDLVVTAYEEEKASSNGKTNGKKQEKRLTPAQKQLKQKVAKTATGGSSFFAWFGYIGRRVSAEESAAQVKKEREEKEALKAGKKPEAPSAKDVEDEEDEDDDLSYDLEIFPDGDDLAVALSEDLWPGALKYFTQAQEADALSDLDFESDDEGDSELNAALAADEDDEDDEAPPAKKQKRKGN